MQQVKKGPVFDMTPPRELSYKAGMRNLFLTDQTFVHEGEEYWVAQDRSTLVRLDNSGELVIKSVWGKGYDAVEG